MKFKEIWQQLRPPGAPPTTESTLPPGSQAGKVFIVTGANSGIGKELTRFLYPTGATIYLAGRSAERISTAIAEIESSVSNTSTTKGTLKSLPGLDFCDLSTVKPAFEEFARQEQTLDIIWNNAGSHFSPGSSTAQGIEAHMGINAVGPLLFTDLLIPLLAAGSKKSGSPSRIVWTGSVAIETNSPVWGIDYSRLSSGKTINKFTEYGASKSAALLLAHEGAARWGKAGNNIISVCQNPGMLNTNAYKRENWAVLFILRKLILFDPKYGAYTMLFAGFSDKITMAQNGCYVWPWGLIRPCSKKEIYKAIDEGKAKEFWDWCEEKIKPFM